MLINKVKVVLGKNLGTMLLVRGLFLAKFNK